MSTITTDIREKFLESDSLRAVQFLVNTVQKPENIMQKEGNKMQIYHRMETVIR